MSGDGGESARHVPATRRAPVRTRAMSKGCGLRGKKAAALLVAGAVALAGCASTPVEWQGKAKKEIRNPGDSVADARKFLDAGRTAYRSAAIEQMRWEANTANGLIAGGALVMALAGYGAHGDAVFGASLLAGTAYGMGSYNLRRQRVLVLLSGVEALNCAERAVLPFDIGDTDKAQLNTSVTALGKALYELDAAMQEARLKRGSASTEEAREIDALLREAELAREAAETSRTSGEQYLAAVGRAAGALYAAVQGIDHAVIKAQVAATPDLSAVPGIVEGLAGMAGKFAPGMDIEARLAGKAADDDGKGARSPQPAPASAATAISDLKKKIKDTAAGNAAVRARLLGRAGPWPADAFKDCGVAQVVAPLAATPANLAFTAGTDGRYVIDIKGGLKPYFVEVNGIVVDGLVVKPPVRFDSRAEVSLIGSKVSKGFTASLRVSDSSPEAQVVAIPVVVAEAKPAGAGKKK